MEQADTARTGTFRIDEPRLSARLASAARAYALERLDAEHVSPMESAVRAFLKGADAAISLVLDNSMETAYSSAMAECGTPTGKQERQKQTLT